MTNMTHQALRLSPEQVTRLEPCTVLHRDPAKRRVTVRFADGVVDTLCDEYVGTRVADLEPERN